MPLADAKPDPKPLTEGGIGRRKPDRANRRKRRKMATEYEWVLLRAEKLGPCRVCENAYVVGKLGEGGPARLFEVGR